MARIELMATQPFDYEGRSYVPGESFEVSDPLTPAVIALIGRKYAKAVKRIRTTYQTTAMAPTRRKRTYRKKVLTAE